MAEKILIIDDSAFARAMVRQILEKAGYQVYEASSGLEALEKFPIVQPNLVTMDLLMPGMEGGELIKHLQTLAASCPVVVITADIQTLTHQELMQAGAAGFLNKPVNEEELLNLVRQALQQDKGTNQHVY